MSVVDLLEPTIKLSVEQGASLTAAAGLSPNLASTGRGSSITGKESGLPSTCKEAMRADTT